MQCSVKFPLRLHLDDELDLNYASSRFHHALCYNVSLDMHVPGIVVMISLLSLIEARWVAQTNEVLEGCMFEHA